MANGFDQPRRHTNTPRLYVSESLILGPDTAIKIHQRDGTSDYGWRDMIGAIVARGVGANDPTWAAVTGLGNMFAYSFAAATMQQIWIAYHIDHDYAEGTPIFMHTHWINAAVSPNTGAVRWGFEYTVAKGHQQQAFSAPTTVYVNQTCNATRYMHHIAEVAVVDAIPATNLEPDSMIYARIFRDAADAADTCSDAVYLLTADCHYQASRYSTKNKAPDFNA
jgi:hypothetical protein